jgi:CRISPR/Cas system Type II protein with McrA/HNH and RuvC-like nuclease domain
LRLPQNVKQGNKQGLQQINTLLHALRKDNELFPYKVRGTARNVHAHDIVVVAKSKSKVKSKAIPVTGDGYRVVRC